MGYKRAGFEVVLANDIDPEMAWHYQKNLHPQHYVLAPINELVGRWPSSLKCEIDLLDGSPPCSSFSFSGLREKAWGKNKHFREGQATQVLDDLFFDFIDVVAAVRPRTLVAENVTGLVKGAAKGYVRLIFERLRSLGYVPQLFLVDASRCGVPQKRERVFVVAQRDDLKKPALRLTTNSPIITAGQATSDLVLTDQEIRDTVPSPTHLNNWNQTPPGRSFGKGLTRRGESEKYFNWYRLARDSPAPTLLATWRQYSHWDSCRMLSLREFMRLGSFPEDYVAKTASIGCYMVGMSVPPKMAEVVAAAVRDQWLA